MSDSNFVNVHEIKTLSDLKSSLGRFAEVAQQSLAAYEVETRRASEWIRERVVHWQREVERSRQALGLATIGLRVCETEAHKSGREICYSAVPPCIPHRTALQQAQQALKQAEENLPKAKAWQGRIEQEVSKYRMQHDRVLHLATKQTSAAKIFLDTKTNQLAEINQPLVYQKQMTNAEINSAFSDGLSSSNKGWSLEELGTRRFLQNSNMLLAYRHPHTTSRGFDPVFFNQGTGEVIIAEMKNWGTEEALGVVTFSSGPTAWDNLEFNVDQLRRGVANNLDLNDATRQAIYDSLDRGDVRFVIMTGPYTRLDESFQHAIGSGMFEHISWPQLTGIGE